MLSIRTRQTLALILAIVVVSGLLITLDQQNQLTGVKTVADTIVRPLSDSFSRLGHRVAVIGSKGSSAQAKQLATVTAERDQLLAENAKLNQLQEEVSQLREQLGFKDSHPNLKLLGANVIGHDPSGTSHYAILDRGSDDGVTLGMAVVTPDFYAGQVTEVDPGRCRVTFATDMSATVAATVEGQTASGIVYGRAQLGGEMEMRYLQPNATVKVGDVIVTSGKTARVPAGLVIGKVTEVTRTVQASTQTLEVAPVVDYNKFQALTIILNNGSVP